MEFVERPNMRAVHYLNSIPYAEFKQECIDDAKEQGEKEPKEKDIKTWFNILKQFCKSLIKTKGVIKRIYSYSQNTPAGLGGRLFCGGSMQGIWGKYRGLLMRGIGTDIDMKNAHPVILRYICQLHNIQCPHLEYYINNRDKCLAEFPTKAIGKKTYLVATNNDKYAKNPSLLPEAFRNYDKEMKKIQKKLVELPDYKNLFETIPEYKLTKNYNGSAINRILCYYENKILQHAIHVLNARGIEIAIPMFDGCMPYGDYYDNPELLAEITQYVEQQMPSLNMQWAYKEHDDTIQIPDDFDENDYEQLHVNNYEEIKTEFERNNFKILNPISFATINTDGSLTIRNKNDFLIVYENLTYKKTVEKKGEDVIVDEQFVKDWLKDETNRTYNRIDFLPKQEPQKGIYNTFTGFVAETKELYPVDIENSKLMKHIKTLTGNDENVFNYFIKVLASKVQQPYKLTNTALILKSKEGVGKDIFFNWFGYEILGERYYFNTCKAELLFGRFNGNIEDKILIIMNEASGKDTFQINEDIKYAITTTHNNIEHKGEKTYKNTNNIQYVFLTNNSNAVKIPVGDRRFCGIECNNKYANDSVYFSELLDEIKSGKYDRAFYDYLMGIDISNYDFTNERPITSFYNDMQQMNVPPIAKFLEYTVNKFDEYKDKDYEITPDCLSIKVGSTTLFEKFKNFVEFGNYGLKYSMTKFGGEVLKFDGITKVKSNTIKLSIDLPVLKRFLRDEYKLFDIEDNGRV